MALEIFDFPYHELSHEYPESSGVLQFGRGYRFVSEPKAPDQVKYKLTFPGLWWFRDRTGYVNADIQPHLNLERLRRFYQRHRLYKKFHYAHPVDGRIIVRFLDPLNIPTAEKDANGLVRGLELKFILEP